MKRIIIEIIRSFIGFFFSPIDAIWGIVKQACALKKYGKAGYFSELNVIDRTGAVLPFTTSLGRAATLIMAGFCIAGFIVALAVPIPGIAPLYLGSLSVGAKIVAIINSGAIIASWTAVVRTGAAIIGGIIDCVRFKILLFHHHRSGQLNISIVKAVFATGICGEAGDEFSTLLKRAYRCCTQIFRGRDISERTPVLQSPSDQSASESVQQRISSYHNDMRRVISKKRPSAIVIERPEEQPDLQSFSQPQSQPQSQPHETDHIAAIFSPLLTSHQLVDTGSGVRHGSGKS